MPLRRVAVLGGGGTASSELPELAEAMSAVGRLLAEQGIEVLHEPDAEGRADGFIALPDGTTTLERLVAICLDPQAADKPCGFLNLADYFSRLLKTLEDSVVERLVREIQRGRFIVERDPANLLRAMLEFRSPETRR